MRLIPITFLLATPALATECPPLPDRETERKALMRAVREAPDERQGKEAANALWAYWAAAPDRTAQEMLDEGMRLRANNEFDRAIGAFDALVTYCPDYAEGYNQRAFVNFLRGDYETALRDLDLALERRPDHFAAMAGKALTLMKLGRFVAGQAVLRQALKLNPWLPERRMLTAKPGENL